MKSTSSNTQISLCLAACLLAGSAKGGADHFANATPITDTRYTSNDVSLLSYTKQVGEPAANDSENAGKTAWWKWTAPTDGICTVNTHELADLTPLHDTALGVFTGSAVNALTKVVSSSAYSPYPNGPTLGLGVCSFHATAGVTYHIVVDAYDSTYITASSHRVRLKLGFMPKRPMRKLVAGYQSSTTSEQFTYSVSFTKTSNYGFSARIKLNGQSHRVRGLLSPDGIFTTALHRRAVAGGSPLIPVGLLLDAKDGGVALFWDGNQISTGNRLMEVRNYAGSAICSLAGRFNRSGRLVESVTVSRKGSVKGAGRALDGTTFTYATPLCAEWFEMATDDAQVRIVANLHRGKGFLYHWLMFKEHGTNDRMESSSRYVRPANPSSSFYPAGINQAVSIDFHVRSYTRPAPGTRALGFLNTTNGSGKLIINPVMGELATKVEETLNFGANNVFRFDSNANRPVLKFNPRTGMAHGSVIDSVGKKRTLFGALVEGHSSSYFSGWASGTTENIPFWVH